MYNFKLYDYVPTPEPVSSNYTICAHYYPGWAKRGSDFAGVFGFDDIKDYPKRTPLLGYYDERLPEVFDWQIKWAVEHGINCFIHCWYRNTDNIGKPVTVNDLRLGHALHEGYFNAKYKDYMKFAIMWELDICMFSDKEDIVNNILPFWVENYFKDNNYLTIDNKPILYIYAFNKFINFFGGVEGSKEVISLINEKIKDYGFDGIHISAIYSYSDVYETNNWKYSLDEYKNMGIDSTFQYCWQMMTEQLTEEQYKKYCENHMLDSKIILEYISKQIDQRIEYDPYYTMYTLTCMRDSKPWFKPLNIDPKGPMVQFRLNPYEWKEQLISTKSKIDKLPKSSIGRQFVVVDNWNEWAEGHFVAPSLGYGFKYLQALREVFTNCDNLPDYRLPSTLGFEPYDDVWIKK